MPPPPFQCPACFRRIATAPSATTCASVARPPTPARPDAPNPPCVPDTASRRRAALGSRALADARFSRFAPRSLAHPSGVGRAEVASVLPLAGRHVVVHTATDSSGLRPLAALCLSAWLQRRARRNQRQCRAALAPSPAPAHFRYSHTMHHALRQHRPGDGRLVPRRRAARRRRPPLPRRPRRSRRRPRSTTLP